MNAIEFFESDALRLPLRRENDHSFEEFLDGVFSKYLAAFDNLTADDELTQSIKANKPDAKTACECIKSAVNVYLRGWPNIAFEKFQPARVRKHFEHLMPKSNQADNAIFKSLYRLRVESPHEGVRGMEFGRKGLFHIPFGQRQNVRRQRYSIPGLPCLYLGSSLYVCWEELGRPALHSVYASAFQVRPGEPITVLDFSQSPTVVARFIQGTHGDHCLAIPNIVSRAVCWPVQAACSIKRLHREAPFIAEYIVPQLLLQWVALSNEGRLPDHLQVDGIVYFSVNCAPDPLCPGAFLNLVFPVREIKSDDGYCPILKAKFVLLTAALKMHRFCRLRI